jgi:hypothetical protein
MNLPQPSAVESTTINKIVITKEDSKIELEKMDDAWILQPQGYPADAVKAKNLAKSIADLKLTALVSESGNYERYNLSPEKKMAVQAFSDTTLVRQYDIGQVAPTFQHTFVKLENDPNVYHARGAFKNDFDQTVESLREKTVLSFDRNTATELNIRKGEHTLKVSKIELKEESPADDSTDEKKDDAAPPPKPHIQWQDAEGNAVDNGALNGLLSATSNLDCEGFLNEKKKEDLTDALWTVIFKSAEKTYVLSLFGKEKEDDTLSPAISSTSPYVFTLTDSKVDNFVKHIDKLLGIEKEKEETAEKEV